MLKLRRLLFRDRSLHHHADLAALIKPDQQFRALPQPPHHIDRWLAVQQRVVERRKRLLKRSPIRVRRRHQLLHISRRNPETADVDFAILPPASPQHVEQRPHRVVVEELIQVVPLPVVAVQQQSLGEYFDRR